MKTLHVTMDEFKHQLETSLDGNIIQQVVREMNAIRNSLSEEEWKTKINEVIRQHDLFNLLLEDPYTRRAFDKPRGYPGDAVMLDYVYYGLNNYFNYTQNISPIGKAIFTETVGSLSGEAVRNRKRILAQYVDAIAEEINYPTILSIACGHLREVNLSAAYKTNKIGQWYALDQDVLTLKTLEDQYGSKAVVVPIEASVRDIVTGSVSLPKADFVYAAGLYDYLDNSKAIKLLQSMFNLVNPGGKVLIANFANDSHERAYMECFMDWWLIYRTEEDMQKLAQTLPAKQVESIAIFRDATSQVVYLVVTRKLQNDLPLSGEAEGNN